MATPSPKDAAVEAFKAKLTKANTGDLEKKFRKGFPDATDAQIATLGRQGMILKLLEQKRAELAKLAAPVVAADPMTQILQMMLAQQKAAEAERAERLEKEKAERAERLALEEKRLKAAEEKEERRLKAAEEKEKAVKAEKLASEQAEKAERLAAEERKLAAEKERWQAEKEEGCQGAGQGEEGGRGAEEAGSRGDAQG